MLQQTPSAQAQSPPAVQPRHAWQRASLVLQYAIFPMAVLLLWQKPAAGVPTYPLDSQYVKLCGQCHVPFNPSLRTGEAWARLMASLDNHFGENAHLPPDATKAVSDYLAANSAEHWDTRAAIEFSRRPGTRTRRRHHPGRADLRARRRLNTPYVSTRPGLHS